MIIGELGESLLIIDGYIMGGILSFLIWGMVSFFLFYDFCVWCVFFLWVNFLYLFFNTIIYSIYCLSIGCVVNFFYFMLKLVRFFIRILLLN